MSQFKFYDFQIHRDGLFDRENDLIPDDLLQAHTDPLYNECRACGRLEETKLNGKVAVRCYGYLTFPAEIEDQLERDFQVDDWYRPSEEYRKPVTLRQPIRATVKEMIPEDKAITANVADKMLRDSKKMRSKGVYAGDLYERNYRAGLLMDFSCARTLPHFLFDLRGPKQGQRMRNSDLYM